MIKFQLILKNILKYVIISGGSLFCIQSVFADTINNNTDNEFQMYIQPLTQEVKDKFIKNGYWNSNCPVTLDKLYSVKMTYWGMDNKVHWGEIIVHKDVTLEVAGIFKELFKVKFHINKMSPYQDYPKGEYAINNDTVGFYCSYAQDKKSEYSSHAYGLAIDINPLLNPFLDPQLGWWPKGSQIYAKRQANIVGQIDINQEIFKIFTQYGWVWGGLNKNIDYMHFSKALDNGYYASKLIYSPSFGK